MENSLQHPSCSLIALHIHVCETIDTNHLFMHEGNMHICDICRDLKVFPPLTTPVGDGTRKSFNEKQKEVKGEQFDRRLVIKCKSPFSMRNFIKACATWIIINEKLSAQIAYSLFDDKFPLHENTKLCTFIGSPMFLSERKNGKKPPKTEWEQKNVVQGNKKANHQRQECEWMEKGKNNRWQ